MSLNERAGLAAEFWLKYLGMTTLLENVDGYNNNWTFLNNLCYTRKIARVAGKGNKNWPVIQRVLGAPKALYTKYNMMQIHHMWPWWRHNTWRNDTQLNFQNNLLNCNNIFIGMLSVANPTWYPSSIQNSWRWVAMLWPHRTHLSKK